MTHIIAQKEECYRHKKEGLMAEVLRQRSDSVMFEMDRYPLPAGVAVKLAPEVSPGEREQAHGEEERIRRPRLGLPSSAEDAAALTQAKKKCPSYRRVMEEHAPSGDIKKKERAVPTESITSVPSRQEAAPMRKAKPVTKIPVPAPVVHVALPVWRGQRDRRRRSVYNWQGKCLQSKLPNSQRFLRYRH